MGDSANPRGGGAVNIEIKIDTSKVDKMLSDFPAALARAQMQALKEIGDAVASRATLAFRTPEIRPSPWAPRKPSRNDDGHPLLIKSSSLSRSILRKLDGSNNTVVVGTGMKYAGYHQFGTKNMPARPYMPIDAHGNLVPKMQRKVKNYVEEALNDEISKLNGHT